MIRHSLRNLTLSTLAPAILGTVLAGAAIAQDDAPPALVGRIAHIEGQVSMLRSGEQNWVEAAVNEPLSVGDALYAQDGGDARIQIGATDIDLKAGSEFDIATLDQENGRLRLDAGSVDLRVTALPTADGLYIMTPRGTARLTQPGLYRIDAGTEDQPTAVTAWNGAAQLGDASAAVAVQPRQTLLINGTVDAPQYSYQDAGSPPQQWREPARIMAGQHYVAADMTGAEDLFAYGSFQTAAEYGNVWYPNTVPADWQPYRYGHWEYVAPWGQTWVDDQPWGFAPFHYGRWAFIGNRWGWVPGEYAPHAVYAPALVAFVGGGGFSASISFGGGEAVGWVPLGPGEPFHPYYRASPTYVEQINKTVIINNFRGPGGRPGFGPGGEPANAGAYANARFATVVPASAMSSARSVNTVAIHVQPQMLEHVTVNQQAVANIRPAPGAVVRPAARPGPVAPPANPRAAVAIRPVLPPHGGAGPEGRPGGAPPAPNAGRPVLPAQGQAPAPQHETAPNAERPGAQPPGRPEPPRPEPGHPAPPTAEPNRMAPAPRPPEPHPEAARPQAERPQAEHPQAERPQAEHAQPPRQEEHPAAAPPRPQPHPEPAQRPAAPAPHPEAAQRPAAPAPHPEPAQRPAAPAPHPEPAQHPQPQPQAQHPQAQPQPAHAPPPKKEPEKKPEDQK